MAVPLLDLTRQYAQIKNSVDAAIERVVASQVFILGDEVSRFEESMAKFIGSGSAVGMSSGTDAQLAILMAMEVGCGDAVITTPFTFFATAGCIDRLGAETVFVDIDPGTFNLDPVKLEELLSSLHRENDGTLRSKAGNRVRAVIPVHLFGLCCEMDPIVDLAARYGLDVIEDAAQAIGSEYPSAAGIQQAGSITEWAYFSFFPAKNLGAFGDGGLSACRTDEQADRLRSVRNHGMQARYEHRTVGGNFRLDALQAAILSAKLPYINEWNTARRRNAAAYRSQFSVSGLEEFIKAPLSPFEGKVAYPHTYHQFVVRAKDRDALVRELAAKEIGHGIYYPIPLHQQECFRGLGLGAGDFPESERAAAEVVALPIFPELREEELNEVVSVIAGFYGSKS